MLMLVHVLSVGGTVDRYKEQLIRQLVKTGHEADQMNKQYSAQLQAMDDEKSAALSELSSLQKALDEAIARERNDKQQTQQLQMYVCTTSGSVA